jgi:hypothetical protein
MKRLLTTILCFVGFTISLIAQNGLPFGRTDLFAGSGSCGICHTSDMSTVLYHNGMDVSPITHWRSTMMGNSSKDPIWRAFVAEEVHKFPQLQQTIESTCTKCHSPLGYTEAIYNGQQNYSMAEMKVDPIANDGVSCTACHQIKQDNFGSASSYSGNYIIENDSINYGPYENPHTQAMFSVIGFTPVYSPHVDKSELCATCHTLFTPYIDNQGNIAGEFPEQTPYLEWKNSQYPGQDVQCQDCHMPVINDGIDIATIPPGHQVLRSPYWQHKFVGGNIYILGMLKENISLLGLTASAEEFETTMGFAEQNLTEATVDVSLTADVLNDSLNVQVGILNKTGHKIPSGIPFRRMWVHLKIEDATGNTIFESGKWDSAGEIVGLDNDFEPHYASITQEDQVQIYEGVFVDVDQEVTYTLLRASAYAKDNRIPPIGFVSTHPGYDTTAIIGEALTDPDFNRTGSTEGTGSDIVNYKIPAISQQTYNITAQVCFQSIKPAVVEHLRNINEPDIIQFISMYDAYPNVPFIMQTKTFSVVTSIEGENVSIVKGFALDQNYPNPFNPSTKITWQSPINSWQTLKVYDLLGNEIATLVDEYKPAGRHEVEFQTGTLTSGIYFYKLQVGNFIETKKMVLLR